MGSKLQSKEDKNKSSDLPIIDEISKSDLKNKKKHAWKDNREDDKFVIEGAKIQCKYCANPITSLVVTSTQSQLQDKKWATVGDNNGATNLLFDGVCTAYPSTKKPLCKEVIKLMGWQSFSFTTIDNYGALRKNSINRCAISQDVITIEHSGQTDEPINVGIEIPPIEVKIISVDTEYFTPLGIQNPQKPDFKSDGKIKIQYEISKQHARSISLSVYSKDDDLIGYDSLVLLDEVVVTASAPKASGESTTKSTGEATNQMFKDDDLKIGKHTIEWDGFGPNDILDTEKFKDQIILQIRVSPKIGGSAAHRKSYNTIPINTSVKWVTAKVDKRFDPMLSIPKNKIDILLRMNLIDGGEKGMSCSTFGYTVGGSPTIGAPGEYKARRVCDWDYIPKNEINSSNPILKTRNRSFEDLVNLVKKGISIYWSRNGSRDNGITIDTLNFCVNTLAENTKLNSPYSLDDIPLIFNTNGSPGRSGNPGCARG